MNALFAVAPVATWGLVDWAIAIVIIAAICGIVYLALQYFQIAIPPILIRIVMIVIVAAFAILAIRFLAGL